ncbi:hypothetical protein CONLIGDRAFT_348908 [Coniochaeta ligniaria NRRL 30616]|uniref:Uncharacterized protein n=1 Tax=Coniochaeta ligniaria NRRL 30616 TaxID=1408157 RepID=A0A1J7IQH9_9PEZI|nr:hypothetical protein CONLIGDRAFT_348908 [Coniochaeta ligniaria NRRL 30616]
MHTNRRRWVCIRGKLYARRRRRAMTANELRFPGFQARPLGLVVLTALPSAVLKTTASVVVLFHSNQLNLRPIGTGFLESAVSCWR